MLTVRYCHAIANAIPLSVTLFQHHECFPYPDMHSNTEW